MYQLTNSNCIIRIVDQARIPIDVENIDYFEYEKWVAAGNTPEPATSILLYPRYFGNDKMDKLFTPDEQIAVVTAAMTDPMVKLMYDRLLGAAYLTYEDPETEQGLSLLVSKGLLTEARKAEIVAEMQPR